MTLRRTSKKRLTVLTAAGAASAVVANLLVGGSGSADPVSLTLNYDCTLPIVQQTNVVSTINADIPRSIHVGEATPEFAITAAATTEVRVADALRLLSATTVEGSVVARSTLTAPDRSDPIDVTLAVARQPVPATGALTLNASGTAPSQRPATLPGNATINVGDITLTMTPRKADGTETALGTVTSTCPQVAGQNNLLATIEILPAAGDTEAPTAPGNARSTGTTTDSVSLAWDASTDNVGVTGYDVFNGNTLATTVTGTTATVTGLTADTEFTFTVKAKDAAGNVSAASNAVVARTQPVPVDTQPPTAPGNARSTGTTANSVSLAWDASTDNVGVTGYDVFNGATVATSVTGTTATVAGLTPDTPYTFTVKAKDAAGNTSPASNAVMARTQPAPNNTIRISFDATGSTLIKKVNGTVPLKGGINAELDLSTGKFLADLNLNPTKGNFKIFGFIPASANIEFAQEGRTTGQFANDTLTSSSKVTVKLPRVSMFGFPISNSRRCMTSRPSDINLKSVGVFNPLQGGKVTGVYTIAPLTGCGLFNGLISALTTGPGNTISIDLKAKPMTLRR